MKRKMILSLVAFLFAAGTFNFVQSQDKPAPKPVRDIFNGTILIDQQTIASPWKGGLEMHIHHRFGTMQNGTKDVFGIYAPSNIRMGLNYGITERMMIGFGSEKDNKLQEFLFKYNFLQQKTSGMPISLSYFTTVAVDMRNTHSSTDPQDVFGVNYKWTNRLSYFHQIIVAKKFGERVSVQLAPSFTHFNAVDSVWHNDYLGISANARVKLFGDFSVIGEFSTANSMKSRLIYMNKPEPNAALGFEIGTPTHCFHLFVATYSEITPQKNLANNQNRLADGQLLVGMNVVVRF